MPWSLFDNLWASDYPRTGNPGPSSRRGWTPGAHAPAMNVHGDDEKLMLVSELPGLDKDNLEVHVHGRKLTITGRRELPKLGEGEAFTVSERKSGNFTRSMTLPYDVDAAKVEANYDAGVLVVTLPRREEDKPRKIEVKVA